MIDKLEQIQDDISYIICFKDNTFLERRERISINDLCQNKTNDLSRLLITYKKVGLSEIELKNVFKLVFDFTVVGNTDRGIIKRFLNFGYIDNNGDEHVTTINLNTLVEI